ncbi:MAG TPA: HAD-IC family P-type ATPase, partial [Candidatus Saccharimonadales bacterium]|nr:HAD-IC family P-type ATPase [Candidatus Saccharimonadales bacterium]
MRIVRTILRFLLNYKLFSLAILTIIAGLILEFLKLHVVAHWLLGVVSLIAVIPILVEMWRDLRTGRYGIDILAVTAIVASVALQQYWAGIVIVVMFTGGEALEDYAEHRAKTELDALLDRVPEKATVIRKNKTIDVKVQDILVGAVIVLKPGEIVQADAVITEGSANFDESSLTGESLPQSKSTGDELLSGSVNIDGAIKAKCVHVAKDSQYEQIIKLVRSAASSQAPVV